MFLGAERPWTLADGMHTYTLRRIFVLSSEEQAACRRNRQRQMERAEAELQRLQANVGTWWYETPEEVRQKAELIRQERRVRSLYHIEVSGEPGAVRFRWERDPVALAEAESLDGYYVLVTNLPAEEYDASAVLQLYNGQSRVERRFSDFKWSLAVRPVFLKDNRQVAALVFVVYLALLVYCLVERQDGRALRNAGLDSTIVCLLMEKSSSLYSFSGGLLHNQRRPRRSGGIRAVPEARGDRVHAALAALCGQLVVSCQSFAGEPLHGPEMMAAMARAACAGGAAGIRANGPDDIRAIRRAVSVPILGLYKVHYPDSPVYITPTVAEAKAVVAAGADLVAVDATFRPRPGGLAADEYIALLKRHLPVPVVADVATVEEGLAAAAAGADAVTTALAGYTGEEPVPEEPDFALLEALVRVCPVPVLAEGRIWCPAQAAQALALGAYAVVVGTAITRPQEITRRFVQALRAGSRSTP